MTVHPDLTLGLKRLNALLEGAALADTAAPRIAIIAGSGLSAIAEGMESASSLGFAEIPGLGEAEVAGHAGRWIVGRFAGTAVHFLAGRRHLYEGVDPRAAVHSIRYLAALGVRLVVLTNAAGGLSPRLRPGDLMLIQDHVNFSFRNPLRGPNDDSLGSRFPDLCDAYDPAARAIVRVRAIKAGLDLKEGAYAQMLGPAYETAAEIALLRRLGAHAVGMSTVPETLAARHAGLRVIGISMITNDCLHKGEGGATTHEEVLNVAAAGKERLARLLGAVLPSLGRVAESPAFRTKIEAVEGGRSR